MYINLISMVYFFALYFFSYLLNLFIGIDNYLPNLCNILRLFKNKIDILSKFIN
jgi:hypothetical protein